MSVREASAADRAAVLELFESMDWDRPGSRPRITPALLEGKLLLVAEDDGELAGFALGEAAHFGRAHLNVACVRPERRRQGIAKALVAEFAARARAAGSEYVTLDVDVTNGVGQKAWQRLGFTEFSRRLWAGADALEAGTGAEAQGESYASIHV